MTETLGSRIREARERYGMSQAELARRIGISGTALNQIESGKTPDPGVSRIIGIARVLGVSMDDLVGLHEDTQAAPSTTRPREEPQDTPQPKRQRPRKAAPVA
ncbi:MAG: helix-turn-helix transcriptional regulator [Candidatus Tectomicrobia bacterium]|uniref:Helix-turn-helix transcriptional regulator n=1 Tax=Tectimicrobiota bacterium TaxID=2528274 RepID=A0A937VYR7_UNCTE|nr:helix-turn-helix transcriptional regulator [Candidatus Tectomicrobia bacterium]